MCTQSKISDQLYSAEEYVIARKQYMRGSPVIRVKPTVIQNVISH